MPPNSASASALLAWLDAVPLGSQGPCESKERLATPAPSGTWHGAGRCPKEADAPATIQLQRCRAVLSSLAVVSTIFSCFPGTQIDKDSLSAFDDHSRASNE